MGTKYGSRSLVLLLESYSLSNVNEDGPQRNSCNFATIEYFMLFTSKREVGCGKNIEGHKRLFDKLLYIFIFECLNFMRLFKYL